MDLEALQKQAQERLGKVVNLKDLDVFYNQFLGKKGEIAKVFASLKALPENQRKTAGERANKIKQNIGAIIEQKRKALKKQAGFVLENFDITRPAKKVATGHLHLITQVQREAERIFQAMGFEIATGPEMETEWYNFDALNVPKDHPARDMQDTFWLLRNQQFSNKSKIKNAKLRSERLLLRTHTSPVQARYMESHQPPLKIMVPGRVFRNEATDQKHEAQFYQIEGLMVDRHISIGNFKAVIEEFLSKYFRTKTEIRLRPGYFAFVEPGFEIDAKTSQGKWIELIGAGMVHPNVFKACGLIPRDWKGFAFGVGVERLAMIKYKIPDLRMFYQNDLRFLRQF